MITVRDLKSEDIFRCLEIYNYYISNSVATFEETPLSVSAFRERIGRITKKYPFLVATDEENILGYAYLDEFNPRSAYRITADLSIYVSLDHTQTGTGSLLYEEIEKRAKELNIENIISIITAENEISLRFHERHGFTFAGELKDAGIKFGRHISVRYYQKSVF